MGLIIRKYGEEDLLPVSLIERENSPSDCKPGVFIRQAGILFAETFFVAECDGEVAGYTIGAFVQHRRTTGWIIRLAVSERHRRRGFGEHLITAVIGSLREQGADEVYLSVAPSNHGARTLYEKHGFEEADFCPAYFGEGTDRFILHRDLTPGKT